MRRLCATGPKLLLIGAALLGPAACSSPVQAPRDAAPETIAVDAPAVMGSSSPPPKLDFSASGCQRFDPSIPTCSGRVPLTLTFTPIASVPVTRFLWTFGDASPGSSERSPTHSYSLPGSYRVTVVGLAPDVGSLQQSHDMYVKVITAPAGAWCDVDMQCEAGLTCWCGSSSPCTPVLGRGLCTAPCGGSNSGGPSQCPSGTTCIDLSVASAPGALAPMTPTTNTEWRRATCLTSCLLDSPCTPGLHCRELPTGMPFSGWAKACFAEYPWEIGARCRDALDNLVDADCAGGLCADLGAHGRCSADCGLVDCPAGSGCAQFVDGRVICLSSCNDPGTSGGAGTGCDDDPLLACELPGGPGPLAFSLRGPPSPATRYCAPKRCTDSAQCGPSGTCPPGGGHCQRVVR